jgi:wyosine [tRNA(Phe)-imidazoG37] synthetase (radical SAM superfamily)
MSTSKVLSTATLDTSDHRRDVAGLTYVYPVVSRRAGGVSVGINLNPNNACNWHCVYCQVPGLVRGAAPTLDLDLLESELDFMLREILQRNFLVDHVAPEARRLNDIALSGNGEPTSSRQFQAVLERISVVRDRVQVPNEVKTILITNGSLMQQPQVQSGLQVLRTINGQIWFKLDRGTSLERRHINGAVVSNPRILQNLSIAAAACKTWIQTCMFAIDTFPPRAASVESYLRILQLALDRAIPLEGVLLYGLARPSFQPEAARLSQVPRAWLEGVADRIAALGLKVVLTP